MIKHIFRPKEYQRSNEMGLFRLMAPSLLSVFLCTACLLGTSWAWFTSTDTVLVAVIQAATVREEHVTVTKDGASAIAEEESAEPEVIYKKDATAFYAEANTVYHLHAELGGNASSGYLIINTPDGVFYTVDGEIDVTLLLAKAGMVYISASWGELDNSEDCFGSGEQLGFGVVIVDTPAEGEASGSEDTAQDDIQMETNNSSTTPSALSKEN